ncbi:MAG: glycerate kinase type-2 family protein [Candidatus Helarchaeota archaeon]
MIIKNFHQLISQIEPDYRQNRRKILLELLEQGIKSVLPQNLIYKTVHLDKNILKINEMTFNLAQIQHIYVVGAGKASGGMAEALEVILGSAITAGFVNIPKGIGSQCHTNIIRLNEANHPIPSLEGLKGAQEIMKLLGKAQKDDLIFVLISGGGSALLPLPPPSIKLHELQALNELLLKSGATIQEINTVRKHCSQIKGGQMSKLGYPAKVVSLIISDVIGNNPDSIASGPTVPDPTTFHDAIAILKKYRIWERISHSIQQYLLKGVRNEIPETPKPLDPVFRNSYIFIIGDIETACSAIRRSAIKRNYNCCIHSSRIVGEAREIGKHFSAIAKEFLKNENYYDKHPLILVAGGEPTVTIKGTGTGGRCQELALSLLTNIMKSHDFHNVVFTAVGTDGIDGFTDAAGVIIDQYIITEIKKHKLNPLTFLNNNDSYNFFKKIGSALIFMGPTGTNVNDLFLLAFF